MLFQGALKRGCSTQTKSPLPPHSNACMSFCSAHPTKIPSSCCVRSSLEVCITVLSPFASSSSSFPPSPLFFFSSFRPKKGNAGCSQLTAHRMSCTHTHAPIGSANSTLRRGHLLPRKVNHGRRCTRARLHRGVHKELGQHPGQVPRRKREGWHHGRPRLRRRQLLPRRRWWARSTTRRLGVPTRRLLGAQLCLPGCVPEVPRGEASRRRQNARTTRRRRRRWRRSRLRPVR